LTRHATDFACTSVKFSHPETGFCPFNPSVGLPFLSIAKPTTSIPIDLEFHPAQCQVILDRLAVCVIVPSFPQ